jgi:hypothetical protein
VAEKWVAKWLWTLSVKPKTRASYESLLRSRILPALERRRLDNIRPSDIQALEGFDRGDVDERRDRLHGSGSTLSRGVPSLAFSQFLMSFSVWSATHSSTKRRARAGNP